MGVSPSPSAPLALRDDEGWLNPGDGLFGDYLEGKNAHRLNTGKMCLTTWTHCGPKLILLCIQTAHFHRKPERTSRHPIWQTLNNRASLKLLRCLHYCLDASKNEKPGALVGRSRSRPTSQTRVWTVGHQILEKNLNYKKDLWMPFKRLLVAFHETRPFLSRTILCFDGMLKHASTGLQKRGLGEEVYLQPLIDRVQSRYEPHRESRGEHILEGIEGLVSSVKL